MRALLRDREDKALRVIRVNEIGYDCDTNEIWISSPENDYIISHIIKDVADSYIKLLYDTGKVDLSDHYASVN